MTDVIVDVNQLATNELTLTRGDQKLLLLLKLSKFALTSVILFGR